MVAAVLTACGPGLGGTGTGAEGDALAAHGAREVPVCGADFADLLGCTAASPGAAPLPSTTARFFAEASPASRTLLAIDGQRAEWRLRCDDRVFSGTFAQVGSTPPRFYGQAADGGGSRVQLASLLLARSAGGVVATLVDADGRTLAGPLALTPVAGVTDAAACP